MKKALVISIVSLVPFLASAQSIQSFTHDNMSSCPIGFSCTPIAPACPEGYVCTPIVEPATPIIQNVVATPVNPVVAGSVAPIDPPKDPAFDNIPLWPREKLIKGRLYTDMGGGLICDRAVDNARDKNCGG